MVAVGSITCENCVCKVCVRQGQVRPKRDRCLQQWIHIPRVQFWSRDKEKRLPSDKLHCGSANFPAWTQPWMCFYSSGLATLEFVMLCGFTVHSNTHQLHGRWHRIPRKFYIIVFVEAGRPWWCIILKPSQSIQPSKSRSTIPQNHYMSKSHTLGLNTSIKNG